MLTSCSNSPRYRTGPANPSSTNKGKPPALKTTSNVNNRKVMTGVSSCYAEDFHGKLTANGEVYDMYGLTAAHKTLPLNTIVRVTNLENNKKSGVLRKLTLISQIMLGKWISLTSFMLHRSLKISLEKN